jgi:nitrite reductase/ring-hydroxylating ferredoxin subunit
VPYRLYHDPELYQQGQDRIFRGKTWSFLALEVEIPELFAPPTLTRPVVVNRDEGGAVHAFVNRCAHRAALVRRELSGNAKNHTCIYHQWCYGLDGGLTLFPFLRGIRGQGGMGRGSKSGADVSDHGRFEESHRWKIKLRWTKALNFCSGYGSRWMALPDILMSRVILKPHQKLEN